MTCASSSKPAKPGAIRRQGLSHSGAQAVTQRHEWTLEFDVLVRHTSHGISRMLRQELFLSRPMAGLTPVGKRRRAIPVAGVRRGLQYGITSRGYEADTRLTAAFVDFTHQAISTGDRLGLTPVTLESL